MTLLEYGFEDHSADGTTVAQTARGEWAGVSVTLAETGNHNLTALAAEAGRYGLPFIDVRLRRQLTGAQAQWPAPLRQAVEATGAQQETGSSSGRHKVGDGRLGQTRQSKWQAPRSEQSVMMGQSTPRLGQRQIRMFFRPEVHIPCHAP
ncbi:hypothetical protein LAJ19_14850 (plasmid) [Deinococcus taeanensis]|uniref:hypothetical protein n=1 Tax=Deinococcus taeanensis TaxID=2737050 RepID=UPI001CDC304D|nr:hypothetical protein [Deinococcus taeanensis]UBV44088.1 hypothetical protein LAJ19_14850 [Deinococcus taeanensis]